MKKGCWRRYFLWTAVLLLLTSAGTAYAAAYPTVLPYPVPRVAQVDPKNGGYVNGSDCYVCSVASLQAYHAGSAGYSYTTVNAVGGVAAGTKLTRSYTGAGDCLWSNDPFWHLIVDKNYAINKGNSKVEPFVWMQLSSYKYSLPYPMELVYDKEISSQATLKLIYDKLATGKPVVIHSSMNGMHASVIIGYRGNGASTLRMADFTVMEIKRWNSSLLNSAAYFNTYAANPASTGTNNEHCYFTLERWLAKTFGKTSGNVNLSWYSNTVCQTAYTEGSAETITFRVIANGGNRLSANTYPYGAAPASRMLTVGDTVTTVGSVINNFGNTWYKLADGSFVWSGILAEPASAGTASVSGVPLKGQFFEGEVPAISGTVSSTDCITRVHTLVWNGESAETGDSLTAEYIPSDKQTTSVNLAQTAIGAMNLKGLKPGFWNLTLTVEFGNANPQKKHFEYEFEVVEKEVTQIIAPEKIEVMCGEQTALNVSVLPAGVGTEELAFAVDHPSVASVSPDGTVTGLYDPARSETTVRISAPNGVSAEVAVRVVSNIVSETFLLNGQEVCAEIADVFEAGQTIPYEYSYTLANDYDPGYQPEFVCSPGGLTADLDLKSVCFGESGVYELTVRLPGPGGEMIFRVVAADGAASVCLPESTVSVSDEAFRNVKARLFYLPDGVKVIGENAFPDGAAVFLNTAALETAGANGCIFIEIGSAYSEAFASGRSYYAQRGARLPVVWSEWSEWSETPAVSDDNTQAESKIQYRSAPVTAEQQLTEWSAWGAWSTTKRTITDGNLMEQQTRTTYPYYCFKCSSCGAHMPYYGQGCLTALGGCGASSTVVQGSWTEGIWLPTAKSQCVSYNGGAKYYTTVGGKKYYYWPESPVASRTEYSYRTRSYKTVYVTGEYGAWGDEAITATDALSVETRTLYRFRIRLR